MKGLQGNLKNVEASVREVEGARAYAKKALKEANAYVVIVEAKMGVLSVEKKAVEQALS